MSAGKRALTAGLAAAVFGCAFGQSDQAMQYLARSMQRSFPVNITTIMLQRDPGSEGSFQRVKVQRSREGMTRCTILQPLRYQGFTLVDDGDRLRTFLPDENLILDQESPGKEPCEADRKLKLAKKNYSFRLLQSEPIAGRDTVCVIASPRYGELEIRKYYLDAATSYPLRLETYGAGREITVVYDTKLIEFPKAIDRDLFSLSVNGAHTVKYNRPSKVVSARQAQEIVGFIPLVPQGLPLGFQAQEVQFNDGPEAKSIVVRLSDGLARATIYETKVGVKMKALENSTVRISKDVQLMLVSDLPEDVRIQLLNAFIQQATSDPALRAQRIYGMLTPLEVGLQASLELAIKVSAFAGLDDLEAPIQLGSDGGTLSN
jgi:hypothetical protein